MTPLENSWNGILIFLAKIIIFTLLIPVLVSLIHKKNWNKPLFIFFLFSLLTFLINFLEIVFIWATGAYTSFFLPFLKYWEISNTFFISILYQVKNFILLGVFYSLIFPFKPFNNYIKWFSYLLALIAILNYCFIEGYQNKGVVNPAMDSIYVFLLPLFYLWFSQQQSIRIPLKKSPYFWISLGLFIPSLMGMFLDFSGNYIHNNNFILFCQLKTAKNAFEILGQILISVGFAHSYYARFIKINE